MCTFAWWKSETEKKKEKTKIVRFAAELDRSYQLDNI